ncbi:peroxidase-related enzyme [Halovenus rubra]|uniref:Peroxidase-related enzyme n=2 Tax=Halovenus rubra TaxID=869890 RepID=A0ABD5X8B4_9EURY|nr:peroxidase-related enzyme [Halovenus rubra]
MADSPMTRFPVPAVEELPEDMQERVHDERERSGFIPNVFLAFAYKPKQARAFFDYYDAIIDDSPLAREEIEMVVVAVSGTNDCLYCVVAHGALARIYGEDPHLAEQLATNHRTANISDQHKAMCDVAVTLTENPAAVDESDIERLRQHGFSMEEIWDIASLTSLFNLSNRMAHFADWRPNDEFYRLGRDQGDD